MTCNLTINSKLLQMFPEKMSLLTCAPSDGSDQHALAQSDQNLHCAYETSADPMISILLTNRMDTKAVQSSLIEMTEVYFFFFFFPPFLFIWYINTHPFGIQVYAFIPNKNICYMACQPLKTQIQLGHAV